MFSVMDDFGVSSLIYSFHPRKVKMWQGEANRGGALKINGHYIEEQKCSASLWSFPLLTLPLAPPAVQTPDNPSLLCLGWG